MNITFKQKVRNASPRIFRLIYTRLKEYFGRANLAAPVVQMYINDEQMSSVAGFNNFLSFLLAEIKTCGYLEVVLYDTEGSVILEQSLPINHFESRFVDVSSILDQNKKSSRLGLISIQLTPKNIRRKEYKTLGVITSHFFMFYRGKNGSVAMLHPSSILDPSSIPSVDFVTNQIVDKSGLKDITLYQCNPSAKPHEMLVSLQDAFTHKKLCSQQVFLPAMGVREITFDIEKLDIKDSSVFRVHSSSLPTSNSKPMLCRHYLDGRFSMSHS